jgi:CubicO group peptidase (beta-lactamase class C family)
MRKYFIPRKTFCLILLLANFFSQAQNTSSEKNAYVFPGNDWEYNKNPSLQGWDAKKFTALTNFLIDSSKTTGMLVIQHGKVIFEYGDIKELNHIFSCRKGVLAMLYGPFVENGKIDLNRTLAELKIDDIGGLLPIEKKATIKDLLTARSGTYHAASYPRDELAIAPVRGSIMPGSLYLYSNWDFNLAGHIFEKLSGTGIYDAVDSMLARPLKMQDWKKEIQHKDGDTSVSKYPAYPMWFSTRDMARIGYLMLRNGAWENKDIISQKWIQTITQIYIPLKEMVAYRNNYSSHWGYGYLWRVWDKPFNDGAYEGAYTTTGAYGQYITILPKLDMVIAHATKHAYERMTSWDLYLQIVDKLVSSNALYDKKKDNRYSSPKKENIDKYIGEYAHSYHPAIVYKVSFEKDTLRLFSRTPFLPISDTEFISADGLYTSIRFTNIENNKAKNLIIISKGTTVSASRISLIDETAINLNELTGDYYNKELQTGYRLVINDGKLYLTNTGINYMAEVLPVSKDLFMSRGQNLHFIRSDNSKKIRGFILKTRGLKNVYFIKK